MTALVLCAAATVLVCFLPASDHRPHRASAALAFRTLAFRTLVLRTGRVSRRREEARRRQAVIGLCRGLAAELRAGHAPEQALRAAAYGLPAFSGPDALRRAAAEPGLSALGYLSACWEVASQTGAELADVVDDLARGLTDQEAHRQEIAAQMSGPRTTAVVLGVLPVVGIAMSAPLGSGPVTFLFTTPAGLACLFAGLSLNLLGLWWTGRMIRRAVEDG